MDGYSRSAAPWKIPITARQTQQLKAGYRQVKYTWQENGWRYEARWHEKTPLARVINYPSWRLDRVRPGKGFGPDAAPRISETRVGDEWLPTSQVRYCARLINQGVQDRQALRIIKRAHWRSR